jgi:plasmid stabilization system protein ParE
MRYLVILTPLANDDFMESLEWYSNQQEQLEERFYAAITKSMELIAKNPYLFTERKKGAHVAVVEKFPFLIFYKIDNQHQHVVILAILHQSRNPKTWMNR